MAEFPALPLFTDAYIADTAHLTNEEHGVYLRLLMFAWRTKTCSLPDDDARLALMVGVTKGKWAKIKPQIMSFWDMSDDGWKQKKLSSQRDFVEKNREQKRIAGKASARAKSLQSLDVSATAEPTAEPTARQQPIPIPITTHKNYTKRFDEFWALYPKKAGKKVAERSYTTALKSVDHSQLMDGLRQYVTFRKVKEGYILNPATWLNGGHWEDEEEPKPSGANGTPSKAEMYRSMK